MRHSHTQRLLLTPDQSGFSKVHRHTLPPLCFIGPGEGRRDGTLARSDVFSGFFFFFKCVSFYDTPLTHSSVAGVAL